MKYVIPVILAVGTILSALTIAILTQNNSLKGYTWALPYLAIIIAGLLIVALAISIRNSLQDRKRESVNPPPSTTTQTVSQSVSPQQNVYIGKDLLQPNVGDKGAGPPAPKRTPTPKPNVRFLETKTISAHPGVDDGKIYESPQGLGDFDISVAWFRNEAVVGQSIREPLIKAHIVYRGKDGEEITDSPRGVWLEQYGEETIFETGKKRGLVLFLLSNQNTLKKLWSESYTTSTSWMAGGPLFRIRDEGIRGEVTSIEVSLLADDSCLLRATFAVEPIKSGKAPRLVLNSISPQDSA